MPPFFSQGSNPGFFSGVGSVFFSGLNLGFCFFLVGFVFFGGFIWILFFLGWDRVCFGVGFGF